MEAMEREKPSVALIYRATERDQGRARELACSIVWILPDGRIRNPDHESGYANLVIYGRQTTDWPLAGYESWGWDVLYDSVYYVSLAETKAMHRVLSAISRQIEKLGGRFGPPTAYAAYVAYAAYAVGATRILVQTKESGWSYDDAEYRHMAISEGIDYIRQDVAAWYRQHCQAATETASA